MKNQADSIKDILYRFTTILVIVFILISCEPFTTTSPSETVLPQTSDPTQAVPRTPPALPGAYQSPYLNSLDTPRTYIQNTCQYLHNKWNPLSAEPGTVVMIVMFNEIVLDDFDRIMDQLHSQGFEAIDTKQLLAFMERNVKIPPRSVLIIQNDSHPAADFTRNFREYWDRWGWIVVNGWTSDPDASESLLQENIALEYEGWVDHQAQGIIPGTILSDDSSKAVVTRELEGSINTFTKLYAKNPIAFIWPGGGFGQRPVIAARQLGYQLGFTTNARGPVMYNWVPLANEIDPARPTYIPEGYINDPLMTLPRYWPDQILNAIDEVRVTGNEAARYAQTNKAIELEYYDIVCASTYGPMPTP
jgi:biopolymer transport protein ExbD